MSQITEPRDTGGPAFPCDVFDGKKHTTAAGMDLRDYFAAKAMHVTIQMNDHNISAHQAKQVARFAYMVADAMLAQRGAA